jgi:hypothetical protein
VALVTSASSASFQILAQKRKRDGCTNPSCRRSRQRATCPSQIAASTGLSVPSCPNRWHFTQKCTLLYREENGSYKIDYNAGFCGVDDTRTVLKNKVLYLANSGLPMPWAQGVAGSNPAAPTKSPLFSGVFLPNRAPVQSAGGRESPH